MVSVLAWSMVHGEFEPWLGQTKDYNSGMCCFTAHIIKESEQRLNDSES